LGSGIFASFSDAAENLLRSFDCLNVGLKFRLAKMGLSSELFPRKD